MKTLAVVLPLATALPLFAQSPEELPPAQPSTEELPPFDDYLPEPAAVEVEMPPAENNSVPEGMPMEEQIPVAVPAIEKASGAYQLTDASLNDVFQLLAEEANRQYFHNPRIGSDEYKVTGRLIPGDPLSKMEELAFQYGLEMYEKGNTVYALTKDQMTDLPSKEWHYQLRYLRPSDIEVIKNLVTPYLSPGTGLVNFEPKTRTVVVIDTPQRIERVENFFRQVDKPQGQIVVEVKILSVNSSAVSRLGTNWSSTLGSNGLGLGAIADLSSLFGVTSSSATGTTGTSSTGDSNFVLSPFELNGVIRALNEGNLVNQKSNPVVITEDNEQAVISIIDRVPIITSETSQGTGGTTITEEVRYTVDESDPVGDPASTREIGITVAVTPSLLPDGTIRLKMRPRSAQVVEQVEGVTGNRYPRVAESTIDTIARIPNGHSLLIGGFYSEATSKDGTKVPLFGDVPLLNFLFKSKNTSRESSSLIFVVTPTSYSPEDEARNYATTQRLSRSLSLPAGHQSINPLEPGPAHEADYCRTMRAIRRDLSRESESFRR
ncbi:hypothetical protein QEH58_10445 [Roseibacillus persicicus]|nr:hypothetical protein [Roseibacillus persicicus]